MTITTVTIMARSAGTAGIPIAGEEAMRRWTTRSEEETRELGRRLGRELAPDGVLLLSGDLGAGKTVLTRGIGEALGLGSGEVQSPTFTLIREHRGSGGRLVHVDLYRLAPEETGALGLEELLAGPGVKVVEWAERLPFAVPGARVLKLARVPDDAEGEGREIVEATGKSEEDHPRDSR